MGAKTRRLISVRKLKEKEKKELSKKRRLKKKIGAQRRARLPSLSKLVQTEKHAIPIGLLRDYNHGDQFPAFQFEHKENRGFLLRISPGAAYVEVQIDEKRKERYYITLETMVYPLRKPKKRGRPKNAY